MRFTISLPKRLGLFVLVAFLCFVITSLLIGFVIRIFGMTEPSTRILAVIQDLVLFMLPALVTAMLITRLPATFLMLDRRPELKLLMWGLLALVFSIPAMETIIAWNNQIQLPPAIEESLRQAEMQAQHMIEVMLGGHNVGSLVMGILLVGMLAPLAEELFFRGCLQRLFTTGGMNVHLAVWLTAIIFSAMHGQVYGFVPRMLLGALFGYAAVWSHSLWVPVLMHALNNTLYVIGRFITRSDSSLSISDTSFTTGSLILAAASVLLTAACLAMMYRYRPQQTGETV
ncbi:MAG: lysostaphin resistance A-like protein [Muribaculaceae bacterium]